MSILKLNDDPPPKPPAGSDRVEPSPSAASALDTTALTTSAASAVPDATAVEADPLKTLALKPLIIEQLSTVYDPEIPVNIFELRLIYDVIVDQAGLAVIKMTLTAPGCPAAVTLPAEVEGKVKSIDGVSDARIDLVWEPPWTKDLMSEAAKLELGIFD